MVPVLKISLTIVCDSDELSFLITITVIFSGGFVSNSNEIDISSIDSSTSKTIGSTTDILLPLNSAVFVVSFRSFLRASSASWLTRLDGVP